MTDPNVIETALGYLGWHEMADGQSYTGGLLVVDEDGFPQEFRCTEPIRPSTVQSILYGDSFRKYMFTQLIGRNLFDHLSLRPKIVLVDDDQLLLIQDELPVHVAHLARLDDDGDVVQVDLDEEESSTFSLSTPQGTRVSVSLRGNEPARAAECRTILDVCAARMDVYEPFSRVSAVLEALERQPKGR